MNNSAPGRKPGKKLDENPTRPAVPVLQELLSTVAAADRLVAEVAAEFAEGRPAARPLAQLGQRVAAIEVMAVEVGPGLPADGREAVSRLLARIEATVARGGDWLTRAGGPELAAVSSRERVKRAYRLPP